MKTHFRFYATLFGLLICALASFRLWQLWNQPQDAYWTPAHLAMSLDTTSDRFEMLVGTAPLGKVLDERRLLVRSGDSWLPVTATDVSFRVNNYDRARVMRIPAMVAFAALAGGAFVLFVIGLVTPLIGAFRPHGLVDLHLTA